MIKIGHREVLANYPNLQIPKGEVVEINATLRTWNLQISIEFVDDGAEQAIQMRGDGANKVWLSFKNWTKTLGTALKVPERMADLANGGRVEFLAAHYRIGDINLLSLQLLLNKEPK